MSSKSPFTELAWPRKIPNQTERLQRDGKDARKGAEALNPRNDEFMESLQSSSKEKTGVRNCLNGVRVLLVDDNADVLDSLKVILNECGAEVITALSVKDALDAMESRRPHVLVSDILMPDQDGYELIRQLRRRGADRGGQIPAVALTGQAEAEDRVRALNSGFQLFLSKPVEPAVLIAVVFRLTRSIHSDQSDRCA